MDMNMHERRIPFTREDEECIASAGLWGMIAALASLASTLVGTVLSVLSHEGGEMARAAVALVLNTVLAVWLLQASAAFRSAALTEHQLLRGFSKLRSYFMLTGIIIFVVCGLIVLFVVGGLTCGTIFR